jgi:hypothetical protein
MESRATRPSGVWEVVGVLAAVIPCGILAGLYLATSDPMFLAVFAVLAVVAVGIVYFRRPRRLPGTRGRRRSATVSGAARKTGGRLQAARAALRRTFTVRVLKLLGLALWLIAWGVLATLYARVAENANVVGLGMLVLVGGFSPIVIYYGLEAGVGRLSKRLDDDK